MDASTCMELALEGERLCKSGDFNGGVAFFEAAVKIGTNDMRTLSAIYSQLGNAYFYLSNYQKAMDYHKLDLTVARSINDRIGEAKASGNLGNTLKMMMRFDEAIICCKRHLDISKEMGDKIGEGRALYNLGNVYHTKGKSMARLGHDDPGEFPDEVRLCLENAVDYYKQNLDLMIHLGDKSAQGRAYGNLGNTHYLLGNFTQAIAYHEKRLQIAREFNDKAAERRAQCNLGNAHIFLGEFEKAVENYQHTLKLAHDLNDRLVEAQSCYSLGNTYTLLRDYKTAIEYHMRHLQIAQELRDRIGEGRAYWSLGNAMTAIGDHHEALEFAQKHFAISKEIGDITGQATAQMSISDLRKFLENDPKTNANPNAAKDNTPHSRPKRLSMEQMELMKMTPEQTLQQTLQTVEEGSNTELNLIENSQDDEMGATGMSKSHEDFLDMVSKFQSKRMDDQRCSLDCVEDKENQKPKESISAVRTGQGLVNHNPRNHPPVVRSMSHDPMRMRGLGNNPGHNPNPNLNRNPNRNPNTGRHNNPHQNPHSNSNHIGNAGSSSSSPNSPNEQFREELFDLIEGMQTRRMDDQRASLPPLRRNSATNGPESLPPQRNRIVNFAPNHNNNNAPNMRNPRPNPGPRQMSLGANVLPDDEFFEMLMRCQSSRLEDQRAVIPGTSGDESSASHAATIERPHSGTSTQSNSPCQVAPTVPDEDFFSLILRFQAGRIEDQRSALPERTQSLMREPEDEHMKGSSASSRKSSSASTKSAETGSNASSAQRSSKPH